MELNNKMMNENLTCLLSHEDSIFNRDLNYLVSYYQSDVYRESFVGDIGERLDKMSRVLYTYMKTLVEYMSLSYSKRSYIRLFDKMGETLKKYPEIGKERIIVPQFSDNDLVDYQNRIDRLNAYMKDKELYHIISGYQKMRASTQRETVYSTTIADLYKNCSNIIPEYDKVMEEIRKDIFSIKRIIRKSELAPSDSIKQFSDILQFFKSIVSMYYERAVIQMETLHQSMMKVVNEKISKASKMYVEDIVPEVEMKDIITKEMGKITYKYSIKIGNYKARVYEAERKNVSAINFRGNVIVVDNGFFKQPTGVQEAIIYHELGHYMCGDFGLEKNKLPSEKDTQKSIREVKRIFDNEINKSPFKDLYTDIYESELIYLLGEYQADRYGADRVGKSTYKKALTNRFNKILDSDERNLTDGSKRFNQDRMKIRMKLV